MNPPRLVLAGGDGFLGRLLATHFRSIGWDCAILSRRPPRSSAHVQWDARSRGPWESCLNGASALVNLCGRSVNCRYHARNRRELLDSRLLPTQLLGDALRDCPHPPAVWMNASTATLYRHTYAAPWDESGDIGPHPEARDAFSIDLARAWEAAILDACPSGIRPLLLRSAMVLGRGPDPNNVLHVLRRLTRLGLGGAMGHGRQFVSWIHQDDFCRAVAWLVDHPELTGPVNLSAPTPLPNREMMRQLRRALQRPFGLPSPRPLLELGAFFLRTETELVVKSRRVIPARLLQTGFQFHYRTFAEALADLTGSGKMG